MHEILCVTAVVLALGAVRADDKAESKALVEKAVKAMGGKDKLAADKPASFKGKGKIYGMGEGIDYVGEFTVAPPDKLRFRMDFEAGGMKIGVVMVYDGKKAWQKINDDVKELDKDTLAEAVEDMHYGRVESLVPLLDEKGFELSPVGEIKIDDKPAVGIRVSKKGRRDINLFFDKKTNLLVKTERTVKDQMQGGKEKTEERFLSGYKAFDGALQAAKVLIKRDGEKHVDMEITEFERKDKIDPSEFAKP